VTYSDTCRVCGREPVAWDQRTFEDVLLCEDHEVLCSEAARESMGRPIHETVFGTWQGTDRYDDDGREFVVCSRDRGHTSTHGVGTLCRWCFANHVEMIRGDRDKVLGSCDIDPQDVRYLPELRRRRTLIERAYEQRIITAEEGVRVMERLVAPLRGRSA